MSMQEAFRKAARENPKSDMAHQVFDSERNRRDSNHATDLLHLSAFFINIGDRWRAARILHGSSQSLGEIRTQWYTALTRRKRVVRNELEGELLLGAMVERGIDPGQLDRLGFLAGFDAQLNWPSEEMGLSLGARVFVYAVSDLSRYNQPQNEAFAQFIKEGRNKAGINIHDLPVVIPLVNTWLNRYS